MKSPACGKGMPRNLFRGGKAGALNHTFGDSAVSGMSKFKGVIDNIKWAKGSSGGSWVPTDPCPYPSPPIPSLGDIDGEIPKI